MSTTREEILKSAMELPESDRLLLATELMETVPDPGGWSLDDPALLTELESRANDGSQGIAWDSVKAQLLADLQDVIEFHHRALEEPWFASASSASASWG